uniref:Uncharacterized protein n=1 Tax=Chromera velia CCMP2878 TaxID=1169474 RepID=A0A0G4FA56_9ALVE|eukprot:Cvel_16011.t1-p1 / transcript=Cvel_16011.t1 / gene=Cvel_16011 / organism=Chromera_velia_CCMP2878 / gene_product=hypothetical protein / transcript_product=hypothetical protein / location=Cvel_scaffold1214:27439-27890(+) / protein_length=84 / sequence_SO=supercontig / SO=protein_coding / is_pseudo=false
MLLCLPSYSYLYEGHRVCPHFHKSLFWCLLVVSRSVSLLTSLTDPPVGSPGKGTTTDLGEAEWALFDEQVDGGIGESKKKAEDV